MEFSIEFLCNFYSFPQNVTLFHIFQENIYGFHFAHEKLGSFLKVIAKNSIEISMEQVILQNFMPDFLQEYPWNLQNMIWNQNYRFLQYRYRFYRNIHGIYRAGYRNKTADFGRYRNIHGMENSMEFYAGFLIEI